MAKKSKNQAKNAVIGSSSPDLRLSENASFCVFFGFRLKMRLFASFQKFRLFVSISKGFFQLALPHRPPCLVLCEKAHDRLKQRNSQLIDEAISFIDSHYSEYDLTLPWDNSVNKMTAALLQIFL